MPKKLIEIVCENCGAKIFISKDENGKFQTETIPQKPAEPETKPGDKTDEPKENDWFDEII